MKKIIFLVALLSAAFIGQAQVANKQYVPTTGRYNATTINPFATTLDTVTNTGTDTFNVKIATNAINSLTFQTNVKTVSGTPYGTVVLFQATAEPGTGANWKTLYTDSVQNTTTAPIIHTITGNPYTNYRNVVVGTGTQKTSYQSYLLIR